MAEITLKDVAKQLMANNKVAKKTSDGVEELVTIQKEAEKARKQGLLDQLERERESKKKSQTPLLRPPGKKAVDGGKNLRIFGTFGSIPAMLAPLLAGVTALGAAMAGLRGWETNVIKGITNAIDGLSTRLITGMTNVRDAALIRWFGFTNKFADFGRGPSVAEQIMSRIESLRVSVMNFFGVGADGKPIQRDIGKVSKLGVAIVRVSDMIQTVTAPLFTIVEETGKFLIKTLNPLLTTFMDIAKGAGRFVGLIGKFMWPIGVIFSFLDGWKAAMATEGDVFDKISAGVGAFIGDFIGAPLDLLKNLGGWILGKFGFDEEAAYLKNFSIEKMLGDFVTGILGWFKQLFTDPMEALNVLVKKALGAFPTVLDIMWAPMNWVIDKITKLFGFRESDAPKFNMREFMTEKLMSLFDTIKNIIRDFLDIKITTPEIELLGKVLVPSKTIRLFGEDEQGVVPVPVQQRVEPTTSGREVQAEELRTAAREEVQKQREARQPARDTDTNVVTLNNSQVDKSQINNFVGGGGVPTMDPAWSAAPN